jgi:hypothetical protein
MDGKVMKTLLFITVLLLVVQADDKASSSLDARRLLFSVQLADNDLDVPCVRRCELHCLAKFIPEMLHPACVNLCIALKLMLEPRTPSLRCHPKLYSWLC